MGNAKNTNHSELSKIEELMITYPDLTIPQLYELLNSEQDLAERKMRDNDVILAFVVGRFQPIQAHYFAVRTIDCKSCDYLLKRENKNSVCEKCGYCLLERLGLLVKDATPEQMQEEFKFVKGYSMFADYSLDCLKRLYDSNKLSEQVKEDIELLKTGGSRNSGLYAREPIYREWAKKVPRPTKISLARELGICTRQMARDLEKLGID